jgi:sugar phosphate isomerase/epimerase
MEAALDALAGLGVASVEPAFIRGYTEFDEATFSDAGARALGRALASRGLGARGVSAHMDLSASEAEAMLRRRVGFAALLGAPVLVTNAGPAAGRAAIVALLDRAVPWLEDAGVTLALENPGHGSGDLIGRPADGAALVRDLDAPRLRLNLDVGNLVTYAGGADLADGLAVALPVAAQTHLKDVAAAGGDWRFVPLGEGLVDWSLVAREVRRLAPGLPVAIELPLRLWRPGRADPRRRADPVPLPEIAEAIRRSLAAWDRAAGPAP